jgi:tetratricopeptide (TPR) repeat protein
MMNQSGRSHPIHRQLLRQVLRIWDRTDQLGQHPLTDLQIVEIRRIKSGYQRSDTGYGLALREVLREAINQFRPAGDLEEPTERVWRHYLILNREFIEGRSPAYLTEQMGIARSTYNKSQGDALDGLADILAEWEHRGASKGKARIAQVAPADKPIPAPFMSPHGLVGGKMLLDELRHDLISGRDVALSGLPGVGKTALAVALAHDKEVRDYFNAGVLWAGLGQDGNAQSELAKWCGELGLPWDMFTDVHEMRERTGIVRAVIGARRFLVIIDDVWEAQDGLSLRVGGPNCAHLYTTRSPGIAEAITDGNIKAVATLVPGEGVSLLKRFIPGIDPESAYKMVRLVHGLPLGLVIMGKYLQGELRSGQSGGTSEALRRLEQVLEIEAPQTLLNELPALTSDVPLAMKRVLQLTIDTLEPHVQDVLGALVLFPPMPNTFGESAALEITGASIRTLDTLVEQGLLEPSGLDRYTLHKIIAQYARANLAMEFAPIRYIDYFLNLVNEYTDDHVLLGQESRNILRALDMAREMDLGIDLIRGCNAFFPHLERLGLFEEARKYLSYAEKGAGSSEDKLVTLGNLGKLAYRMSEFDQAQGYFQKGLEVAQKLEDLGAECLMILGLGDVARSQDHFEDARDHYQEGLKLARKKAASHHVIDLNLGMGELYLSRDNFSNAAKYYERALNWARKGDDSSTTSAVLAKLAVLAIRKEEFDEAEEYYIESLGHARIAGNEVVVGALSAILGKMAMDRRKYRKAQDYFKDALEMGKKLGDNVLIAQMQGYLGKLAMKGGELYTAKVLIEAGLRLARQNGNREHIIELLIDLAAVHQKETSITDARLALRQALTYALELDHQDYAEIIQKKLTSLVRANPF